MKNLVSISLFAIFFLTESAIMAQSTPTLPSTLASKIQGNYFVHEGYRFDISQVLNDEHLEDVLRQLEWQVYFVTVLNLPQEIQVFFKSISVVVAPQGGNPSDKFITLRSSELYESNLLWSSYKAENPVLLSCFLSGLLDGYLPQGINNSDIVKYFNEAKSLPYYQKTNPIWISDTSPNAIYYFFADSAASYLRGASYDEPFSCYEIQKNQPDFFKYLENFFGPKSGFFHQCFSYHGFNFNWSQMDNFSNYQEVCNACIRQVDCIESTGASNNVMDFFKSVPIKLKPDYEIGEHSGDTLGEYSRLEKSICLNAYDAFFSFLYGNKPDVPLLHELLHAFQDQILLDGDNNPYIPKFYRDAMEHRYYYDSKKNLNYWMTNEYEFFACTATAFLANYTPDEPFERRNISKYQPDYYLYLQEIFGTHHDDMGIVERSLIANATDHLY